MAAPETIRQSHRLPRAKAGQPLILRTAIQNILLGVAEGVMNLRVYQKQADANGNVIPAKQAEVKIGDGSLDIILPATPAGGSSGGTSRFRVKDDLGASLKCRSWDGTTEGGTDIFVAKQPCIRNTISTDVQNGVTFTYSYSLGAADTNGNHYLVRTVSGTDGTTETDDIVPPYIFNCEIYAVAIPSVTLDGNACTYLDTSPRAFAART